MIAEGIVSTRGLGPYLARSPVIQLIGITTAAVIQLVTDTSEYLSVNAQNRAATVP